VTSNTEITTTCANCEQPRESHLPATLGLCLGQAAKHWWCPGNPPLSFWTSRTPTDTHGYEYISISWAGDSPSGKTCIFYVYNNRSGDCLGRIKWFGRWRQYCFYPAAETIYSAGCLADIQDFLRSLR
jgi:hypothetical protein